MEIVRLAFPRADPGYQLLQQLKRELPSDDVLGEGELLGGLDAASGLGDRVLEAELTVGIERVDQALQRVLPLLVTSNLELD